jgi:hypothetical protein
MRLTCLDLSVSALKKCNANPHHRSTIEEKHCVAQQPPSRAAIDRRIPIVVLSESHIALSAQPLGIVLSSDCFNWRSIGATKAFWAVRWFILPTLEGG